MKFLNTTKPFAIFTFLLIPINIHAMLSIRTLPKPRQVHSCNWLPTTSLHSNPTYYRRWSSCSTTYKVEEPSIELPSADIATLAEQVQLPDECVKFLKKNEVPQDIKDRLDALWKNAYNQIHRNQNNKEHCKQMNITFLRNKHYIWKDASVPGYIFKAHRSNQHSAATNQLEFFLNIGRIPYSQQIAKTISELKLSTKFTVPQKWCYFMPVFLKNYPALSRIIVVAQELDVSCIDYDLPFKSPQDLTLLVDAAGMSDCGKYNIIVREYPHNDVAIIDTEPRNSKCLLPSPFKELHYELFFNPPLLS